MQMRHGDVFVQTVDAIPDGCKPLNHRILAEGEVTGHAHRLDVGELMQAQDGRVFLKLDTEGKLSHEEHGVIHLPPGTYEVRRQKEYSPEAIRNVAD